MQAAGQGSLRRMNGVGYSYFEGLGAERDVAKGYEWLLAAAQAGQPNAMQTLGAIFLDGTGRAPDFGQAYRWLSLAVRTYPDDDEKLPSARAMRDRAAAMLSDRQRADIDALMQHWQPVAPRLPD